MKIERFGLRWLVNVLLLACILVAVPTTVYHLPGVLCKRIGPFPIVQTEAKSPRIEFSQVFPVPDGLSEQIDFWKQIFTQYSTRQVVIHDDWYLDVIYAVVDLDEYPSRKAGRQAVQEARKTYRELLARVAEKWDRPWELSQKERRILHLFDDVDPSPRFPIPEAHKRVRAQLGQADNFKNGIIRSGRYLDRMQDIFSEQGLPTDLTCLPLVESSFNPHAVSFVGAAGMWQFMRGTGRQYGLKVGRLVDERRDPLAATHAAARLLSDNYQALGVWPLAITAYNHGLQGMKNAVKQTGTTDIVAIIENYRSSSFGFASRNFYAEFVAAARVFADAPRYFGELTLEEPLELARVSLPHFTEARTLEQYCKIPIKALRELNPALHRSLFRPGKYLPKGYTLNLLSQQAKRFETLYASVPDARKLDTAPKPRQHRVRRGQTLSYIAQKYGISVRDLMRENGLRSSRWIRAGQKLSLPGSYAAAAEKQGEKIADKKAKAESKSKAKPVRHRVRPGQTLIEIAANYDTTVRELMRKNRLRSSRWIRAGQYLQIPAGKSSQKTKTREHRVRRGQTLIEIARMYNSTVRNFQKLNRIKNPRSIRVGQLLKIPGKSGVN